MVLALLLAWLVVVIAALVLLAQAGRRRHARAMARAQEEWAERRARMTPEELAKLAAQQARAEEEFRKLDELFGVRRKSGGGPGAA